MNNKLKFFLVLSTSLICFQIFAPAATFAQRRDHLTAAEIELIRDRQSIDGRMEIYLKAIDRRLMVLNNDQTNAKPIEKETGKWGEPPKGTRAELLRDIEKILDESISKIDDVAAHDQENKLIPVAVNILADGVNRLVPELKTQLDKSEDRLERGAILTALDYCSQIVEASAKAPKLSEKERKKIQKEVQKEIEKSQQSN